MLEEEMYQSLKSQLSDVVPDVELRYKAGFHAQELLVGLPGDDETPRWDRIAPLAGFASRCEPSGG